MNIAFFRSEEALDTWLEAHNARRGVAFTIPALWQLTVPWYQDRLSPEFRGRTLEQAQAIFREAGLTSSFWQI
jgi:hypothetical protein